MKRRSFIASLLAALASYGHLRRAIDDVRDWSGTPLRKTMGPIEMSGYVNEKFRVGQQWLIQPPGQMFWIDPGAVRRLELHDHPHHETP